MASQDKTIPSCTFAFPLLSWQKLVMFFYVVASVFAFVPCPEGGACL